MTKYKVIFNIHGEPFASIEISSPDEQMLNEFIYRFYPDTNYEYEVIE